MNTVYAGTVLLGLLLMLTLYVVLLRLSGTGSGAHAESVIPIPGFHGGRQSKSTFSLLAQLFALQPGDAEEVRPVLTIPVGG